MINTEFMAIQRQAGFKAQGISGTKPNGSSTFFNKDIPEYSCVFIVSKKLKANGLTGVTGSCKQHFSSLNPDNTEVVSCRFRHNRITADDLFHNSF